MVQSKKYKIKTTRILLKLLGYSLSLCFFSLALLHFSPGSRFALQNWLIGLDTDFQQSLYEIAGGPYFIHNLEDSMAFHVSMVHKLPTRYVRDIFFWGQLDTGMSFAVEPLQTNEYGVIFLFFENSSDGYEFAISLPNKELVCLKRFQVWRFAYENSESSPSYAAVNHQYKLRFSTDGTDRWKQLEVMCDL